MIPTPGISVEQRLDMLEHDIVVETAAGQINLTEYIRALHARVRELEDAGTPEYHAECFRHKATKESLDGCAQRVAELARQLAVAKKDGWREILCHKCNDTGWNHGVQCKPSKAHPTGWKSERCACNAALSEKPHDED